MSILDNAQLVLSDSEIIVNSIKVSTKTLFKLNLIGQFTMNEDGTTAILALSRNP
jgi:hypothetical protein